MKKVVKKTEIALSKTCLMIFLLFLFTFGSVFALRLDLGVGVEKVDHVAPFVHGELSGQYFVFENDFTYLHEFGMIDTMGVFLKSHSKLAPKIGIAFSWGYHQNDGFFLEQNGLFVYAGIGYYLEAYSISFNVGEYVTFDGRVSERPIIKFSCSIKIGEW